ncbi:MAG: GTP-dependent dephospho-CoA kinase family protein [Candidatus Nitrosocaldus sp.]
MQVSFSSDELNALKRPLGLLIEDSKVSRDILDHLLKDARMVISVGDATTERLIALGFVPDIQIVDGRERRYAREEVKHMHRSEVRCRNPAGTISKDAIDAISKALTLDKPVRVYVDGEEDLLGLVVLRLVQDGSIILYGQPLEGMVLLKVDEESKRRLKHLLSKLPI